MVEAAGIEHLYNKVELLVFFKDKKQIPSGGTLELVFLALPSFREERPFIVDILSTLWQ